ncbi:hypothetical protein [Halonatronum saccharophilum]|uniref:hypothetical protein n=1 Tax=Halonatronum saccharophilum TaxID=150060 RepID=UPI0004816D44|nr:hypothetical protein [Halonatronum saccharophilum]
MVKSILENLIKKISSWMEEKKKIVEKNFRLFEEFYLPHVIAFIFFGFGVLLFLFLIISTLNIDPREIEGVSTSILQLLLVILILGFFVVSIMFTYVIYSLLGVEDEMNQEVGVYVFKHKASPLTRKVKGLKEMLDFLTKYDLVEEESYYEVRYNLQRLKYDKGYGKYEKEKYRITFEKIYKKDL